jgi:hypothetical protein
MSINKLNYSSEHKLKIKENEKKINDLVLEINSLLKLDWWIKIKHERIPPYNYKHIVRENYMETDIIMYIKSNAELINILNAYLVGLKHCYRLKNNE